MNAILTRKSILTAIADAYDELTSREQTVSEFGVWGFFNENELAEEMTNSQFNPGALSSNPEPEVEDFEKIYTWFLS